MKPYEVLGNLFDKKILNILRLFIKNNDKEFYLREIARNTNVSAASTYRIINKLLKMDVIELRKEKTAKLYRLKDNEITEFLESIIEIDALDFFVEKVSEVNNVEEILLLGKKKDNKANLVILGNNIDSEKITFLTKVTKQNHNFNINHITISRRQYSRMLDMGLYPGNKKTLYKR